MLLGAVAHLIEKIENDTASAILIILLVNISG